MYSHTFMYLCIQNINVPEDTQLVVLDKIINLSTLLLGLQQSPSAKWQDLWLSSLMSLRHFPKGRAIVCIIRTCSLL